jgi:hypothetical protein
MGQAEMTQYFNKINYYSMNLAYGKKRNATLTGFSLQFWIAMTCMLWVGSNQLDIRDFRDVKAPPLSTSFRKYKTVRNIP